ncbi:hypothetical protein [Helicobacter turcicus]|uniref:Plasmid replication protein RepL domain-containing protein n=1 Tax=Helicobacter turcicus TaxID=2867412 RepID=A0ABS7JPE3_9HELI|nr:hypothetical protein [Helicobacter turcicus]MBX7491271.1 hypothetical protein [Helicobacter turcicus]MBX7546090.1 hypothetical protein [Helicobacter turcicus]
MNDNQLKMLRNQDITGIKELNLQNDTRKTLIAKEKQYINHLTGEVLSSEQYSVQVKTKDEFVKLFVENIEYLGKKLDGFEFKTLFFILRKMDYQNSLVIDSTFKKNLSIAFDNKSPSVISRAISGLISKNILLKIDTMELKQKFQSFVGNSYYVNPNIIGKGSFRDIKKLRQTIVTDFDFDNNSITKTASIETTYNEGQDLLDNTEKYKIDNIQYSNDNEKREQRLDVLVQKQEDEDLHNDDIIECEVKNDEPLTNADIVYEIAQIELKEAQLKLRKATLSKQYNISDS